MRVRAVVTAVALLWPVSVFSETATGIHVDYFATGNDLYRLCSDDPYPRQSFCGGYVEGVTDAINVVNALKANGLTTLVCIPQEKVSVEQVKDVMVQWLTNHPERRHQAAAGEELFALVTAFPCK